jgi:hypothetical protein
VFTYEDLLFELCITPEEHIGDKLPPRWNHLVRGGFLTRSLVGKSPETCRSSSSTAPSPAPRSSSARPTRAGPCCAVHGHEGPRPARPLSLTAGDV